jgi:hypothetical protein
VGNIVRRRRREAARGDKRIEKLEYVLNDGRDFLARHQARRERVAAAKRKLNALDIFAGCGGLTLGLHGGGAVDTNGPLSGIGRLAPPCWIAWEVSRSITRTQMSC